MCHCKCTEYFKFGETFLVQLVLLLNNPSQISGINNNHYFIIMFTAFIIMFPEAVNSDKAQWGWFVSDPQLVWGNLSGWGLESSGSFFPPQSFGWANSTTGFSSIVDQRTNTWLYIAWVPRSLMAGF